MKVYLSVAVLSIASLLACTTTSSPVAEKSNWIPLKESGLEMSELESYKKRCKEKIPLARSAGFSAEMAENAFFHCMESKGWQPVSH